MPTPFHLAYNVRDLAETRAFYAGVLGCAEGRSTETWVDFDFFGHQISLHLGEPFATQDKGKVDDHTVPMPYLGVVLPMKEWQALAVRLEGEPVDFVTAPNSPLQGRTGRIGEDALSPPVRQPDRD